MKGLAVFTAADSKYRPGHPIAGHRIDGAHTCALVSPDDYSLWMVTIDVDGSGEIHLPQVKGDEAVYVTDGAIRVGERECRAGGTVIIEAGAHDTIHVTENSRLLHMGPTDPVVPADGLNGPIDAPGIDIHVVGPAGRFAAVDSERDSRYFADSTCETCRLTLLYTSRSSAYVSAPHSHSVDELIHVLWGEIQLGSYRLGPGDTLAVEADHRYGFRSVAGFGFLNYRSDASEQTLERGRPPRREGALVNGFSLVADSYARGDEPPVERHRT